MKTCIYSTEPSFEFEHEVTSLLYDEYEERYMDEELERLLIDSIDERVTAILIDSFEIRAQGSFENINSVSNELCREYINIIDNRIR